MPPAKQAMSTAPSHLPLQSESPPLRVDEKGVVRVGGSRVTLDLVVEEYQSGMSPESMVEAYDSLRLPDVYGAIAFYLKHRDEVDAYLESRAAEAAAIREDVDGMRRQISRDELLSREATTASSLGRQPKEM